MSALILSYPKQQAMYNPEKPAILLEGNTQQSNKEVKQSHQLNVVDRLYQQDEKKKTKIKLLQQEKDSSLTPKQKSYVNKQSQKLLNNLQLKPFLQRQEEVWQEKRMKEEFQKLLVVQEEEQIQKNIIIPTRSLSQFIKDSQNWVQYKEQKKQHLLEERKIQNEHSFKPALNPKSLQIAEEKMKKSGLNQVDQKDRLSMPKRDSIPNQKENYNHSPCINPKSRMIVEKNKQQRSKSPWNRK
ncbi:unnamed protein product (macronuclear) [Paramecium tetraurelia]|uniref:TPX2 C-terminal domain-containing protein n=1 Tax=Paramecium tetraurelia TaxID=5888 RepID=A0C0K2_PARTE|nr:uncharacterized protein GSPATT00006172001 [Paramecium tetraurelia]CAK64319.1 unnamed protein product [Paramecium tetraurelia]|eukprot:XP_001431717.1 hypothetical protein (macronuclear) [Paramecium tetraurelia strain d4-2]